MNKEEILNDDPTEEQKNKIVAESASRRVAVIAIVGVLREMFTSYLYDAKMTDKKVLRNMKAATNRFFWLFDAQGNNDNMYMGQGIERFMAHAEEILDDREDYKSRLSVFTIFISVLDYVLEQYKHEVVFTDKEILYNIKLLSKSPARHFNKQNGINIEKELVDVLGHLESFRETTEKISLGEEDYDLPEVQ